MDLPDELVLRVFHSLTFDDLQEVARVDRRFHHISYEDSLWKPFACLLKSKKHPVLRWKDHVLQALFVADFPTFRDFVWETESWGGSLCHRYNLDIAQMVYSNDNESFKKAMERDNAFLNEWVMSIMIGKNRWDMVKLVYEKRGDAFPWWKHVMLTIQTHHVKTFEGLIETLPYNFDWDLQIRTAISCGRPDIVAFCEKKKREISTV